MGLFPLTVSKRSLLDGSSEIMFSHHLPSLFAIFAGILFLLSVTIGCGRCLVCAEDTDCTELNWVTIARITALGFPSRLYALSMFLLALTLGVQSELHGVLYGHTGCRRSVGWLTSFSLLFRVIFPEDVYNEASLPLLEEAQPEGDGGRALSVIALCMFILWAALNVMDTSRDQRINNRIPLLAKTGGLSLCFVTSLVTICCRTGALDWPKTGAIWEGMCHIFLIGQLIMSMWETHKMEFRQKVSPKKSRMVTLAFIVLCCILFFISAITGCQHCLQCYSTQESCRQLAWVSLARITAIGSAGRLLALSRMCFATGFMWQTFLLGLWCDLNLFTRLLSHLVSWTVLFSIVFPQHVYQQGAFAYQMPGKTSLPVAEPESTLGGISNVAAIFALSIWQVCFFVQRIAKTRLLVTVLRIIGLGIAMVMTIVYIASFYEDEELIFEWGTELYAMCLIWIFLILTFATTVYETYDMGVTMFITSPVSMKNASTIAPFGLSANERAAHDIDGDQRMLNITQDTIPQSRHQGYNNRQQRVPQPTKEPREPAPAHWCPEVGECPLCTAHAQGQGPSTAQPAKQSSGGGGASGQFVVDPDEQPAVPMAVLQSKPDVDSVSNNSPVDEAPLDEQAIPEQNPAQAVVDDDGVATDDEVPADVEQEK